jgi:hypothetical protein
MSRGLPQNRMKDNHGTNEEACQFDCFAGVTSEVSSCSKGSLKNASAIITNPGYPVVFLQRRAQYSRKGMQIAKPTPVGSAVEKENRPITVV